MICGGRRMRHPIQPRHVVNMIPFLFRMSTSTYQQVGTTAEDQFFAAAVGEDDSYVLAGQIDFDFSVIKLDADGNELWRFQVCNVATIRA